MQAEKLISDVVISVSSHEKGQKVLNWMDVFRVSHLPVVDNKEYLGIVSDKLIYDLNLLDKPISEQLDKLNIIHVHKEQHIFEVAMMMYKLKLSVIPVLNAEHYYMGSITLYDLARKFAHLFSLQELGGVIILEVNVHDYSLSEISKIVESNGVKILSSFLDRKPGTSNLDVILKLDHVELSPLIQTFMRYDYNVKAVYLDHSMLNDLYKDRYEQFMKFMNI
ncbi:MAG: CBS domain-containing protein [Prolixibacteraceae bacterium]|nr:CBS domain-containing protein [Prolixibacteraceae bacterium]